MMRSARPLTALAAGLIATFGLCGQAAQAATTWYSHGGTCGAVGDANGSSPMGNTCTTAATADGQATVSAWANTGAAGAWETARLTRYSGGFGVRNRCANAGSGCTDDYEGTNPEHAVDDEDYRDYVLYDFGMTEVALTGVRLGWKSNDSDLQVFAYTGSGDPANYSGASATSLLSSGWSLVADLYNVPVQTGSDSTAGSFNAGLGYQSSWWLITSKADGNADYFKLYSVTGTKGSERDEVPEPGALALAALGLMGLGVARRRASKR